MSENEFPIEERYTALVKQLVDECYGLQWAEIKPGNTTAGRQILSSSREEQRKFALAILGGLNQVAFDSSSVMLGETLRALIRRKLPFEHDEVIGLLNWALEKGVFYTPKIVKIIEDYLDDHPLTPELQNKIIQLIELID